MNEQLSALMDSELSDAEAARFIKSMKTAMFYANLRN